MDLAAERHRPYRMAWLLAVAALSGVVVTSTISAPGSFGASADKDSRFAGMPSPEAMDSPVTSTSTASSNALSYLVGGATIRLAGLQRLYRINTETGAITNQRRVDLGIASVFSGRERVSTFAQRPYVQLSSGRFAGWWVAAPAFTLSNLTRYSTAVDVRLKGGRHHGLRFYANGTVRTRLPVDFSSAATFQADRKASFAGRMFFHLSSGPLSGRWVSARGATLVSQPTTSDTPGTAAVEAPAATWRALVLIYRDTDLTFARSDGSDYHLQAHMNNSMHNLVLDTLGRFRRSVANWSAGMAAMTMDVVTVPHPLRSLDSLWSGYWVGPRSVEADVDTYAPAGKYDSIFVIWQAKDDKGVQVPVGGWGLSLPPGSWANGAGFSSVITPTWEWWWTNSAVPQEVFVHEWMHQVIYFQESIGDFDFDLHAGSSYGYQQENGTWKRWLSDVMQGKVRDGNRFTGISAQMWAAGTPRNP